MSWFNSKQNLFAWISQQWIKLCPSESAKDGATSIEYAVIASLIAVAIVGAIYALSGNLKAYYDAIATAINSAI